MIQAIQDYISELYPEMTFGQIQDDHDNIFNMNIYDTGNNPFFKDGKTHIFNINLFIRDTSFEGMQLNNEKVCNSLNKIYDINISNIHIVDTNKRSSQEPTRDEKNRYGIHSTFEMLVEEV